MAKKLISYDDEKPGLGLPDVVAGKLANAFSTRRAQVRDTFEDTPDGTRPTHTDTGQEWHYFPPQGMEVRDGNLRSVVGDFGTHPHAEIQMGENITRMGATFRFSSEGGTRSSVAGIALVAWGDGGLSAPGGLKKTRAHVDLTPTSCGLSVSEKSAPEWGLNVIGGRYTFPTPLELDTWYTLEWYIIGDTAAMIMPDGHVHVVSDPRIESVPATVADFELAHVPTASNNIIPEFREVWADATTVPVDGTAKIAFQALQAIAADDDQALIFRESMRAMDYEGVARSILKMVVGNTLILENESTTDPREQIHIRHDGTIVFQSSSGVKSGTFFPDGVFYPPKLHLSTSGHSLTLGSGSPEGVTPGPRGSLYVQYNGVLGQMLWVREQSLAGNNGWRPMGHPAGATTLRPSTPIVGLSFFDTTLGRPIWWNDTAWVDAAGDPV